MPRIPGENYLKMKKIQSRKEYNRSRPVGHDFYQSTEWRKLRGAYRRAHPLCEECLREGRTEPAVIVDHVEEIADGGDPYDWDNLRSMCLACHNRKTAAERRRRAGGGGSQNSRPLAGVSGGSL
ncbi:HNH endonuclease [Pyramidobacter sp.]|uniref:HNH endonuclease n=1 Tax=Pyramidobacter sp. TaxID=1943581 RepID=UPI0025E0C27F|nr:HNH endonuclease signature motif containing protein [Pyramidobacter sp.]MDY3213415.1 HNH endonuclease signature motif containing protein [Pyramidobacter sp.]